MGHIFVPETQLINEFSMRCKEIGAIIQLFNYMLNSVKNKR